MTCKGQICRDFRVYLTQVPQCYALFCPNLMQQTFMCFLKSNYLQMGHRNTKKQCLYLIFQWLVCTPPGWSKILTFFCRSLLMAPCKGNCQAAFIIEECSNLSSKNCLWREQQFPHLCKIHLTVLDQGKGGGYCGVSDRCGR